MVKINVESALTIFSYSPIADILSKTTLNALLELVTIRDFEIVGG